jgi:shikimate dehydrogenase
MVIIMEYGLIGEKLGHSFSKIIHEKIASYLYELVPLTGDEFDRFMNKRDFLGINVTIPYKSAVIPFLDEMDDNAKEIGAVNTIVKRNNKLIGFNTDYYGFLYTIEQNKIKIENQKVIVLGTGGAAKSVIAVLKTLNAKDIITVKNAATNGAITYDDCFKYHQEATVVINTSPIGMYPNIDNSPMDLSKLKNLNAVVDLIYNPLKTKLLLQGEELGLISVNGLEMLVAQAVFAAEYFLDVKYDKNIILETYEEIKKSI